jgi:hypothetical protein
MNGLANARAGSDRLLERRPNAFIRDDAIGLGVQPVI